MNKIRNWIQNLKSRFWCLYIGCDGRTGEHHECATCSGYTPSKTNCDIPE